MSSFSHSTFPNNILYNQKKSGVEVVDATNTGVQVPECRAAKRLRHTERLSTANWPPMRLQAQWCWLCVKSWGLGTIWAECTYRWWDERARKIKRLKLCCIGLLRKKMKQGLILQCIVSIWFNSPSRLSWITLYKRSSEKHEYPEKVHISMPSLNILLRSTLYGQKFVLDCIRCLCML